MWMFLNKWLENSLEVQWLGLSIFTAVAQVQYLVMELRSHGVAKKKKWLSFFKKWNDVICSNMDKPRDYCTKWSKSDTERQISYDITYTWYLKNDTNELIYKTNRLTKIEKNTYLNYFSVHLKLTQYCKSMILQSYIYKIYSLWLYRFKNLISTVHQSFQTQEDYFMTTKHTGDWYINHNAIYLFK